MFQMFVACLSHFCRVFVTFFVMFLSCWCHVLVELRSVV